jgi:glycopeptide antibiotics resistance protein
VKPAALARLLFALWLLALVAVLFPWGDVTDHTHWMNVSWVPFRPPIHAFDIAANTAIFIPFGFLWRRSWASSRFRTALSAAGALSVCAESVQLFSHARFPSATDVATNVIGAAIGLWLAAVGRERTQGAPSVAP